jgi:uncharacterized RDD family membrane protein YckC
MSHDMLPTPLQEGNTTSVALSEPIYATIAERFGAYVLDSILIGLPLRIVNASPLFAVSCFMMYRFLAHLTLGTTVGKYIVGIEVVQEHGKRMPRPVAMLLRDTVGFIISSVLLGAGYWWASLNRNGKAWSDTIAGTIVRERKTDPRLKVYCWIALGLVLLTFFVYSVANS